MSTVILPPGGNPIAVNKYIIYRTIYHIIYHITSYHNKIPEDNTRKEADIHTFP